MDSNFSRVMGDFLSRNDIDLETKKMFFELKDNLTISKAIAQDVFIFTNDEFYNHSLILEVYSLLMEHIMSKIAQDDEKELTIADLEE